MKPYVECWCGDLRNLSVATLRSSHILRSASASPLSSAFTMWRRSFSWLDRILGSAQNIQYIPIKIGSKSSQVSQLRALHFRSSWICALSLAMHRPHITFVEVAHMNIEYGMALDGILMRGFELNMVSKLAGSHMLLDSRYIPEHSETYFNGVLRDLMKISLSKCHRIFDFRQNSGVSQWPHVSVQDST